LQHQLLNQQLDNLRRKVTDYLISISAILLFFLNGFHLLFWCMHEMVNLFVLVEQSTGAYLGRSEQFPVPHGNESIQIFVESKLCMHV
jgi:hypothetical protein